MKIKLEKWQDVPKYVIVKQDRKDDINVYQMPDWMRQDVFEEYGRCGEIDQDELAKYWGYDDPDSTVIFGMKLNYC